MLLVAGALAWSAVCIAQPLRVPGKPSVVVPKALGERAALRLDDFPAGATSRFRLPALAPITSADAFEAGTERRERIGIARHLDTEVPSVEGPRSLRWIPVAGGGAIARLSLTSTGASALRVGWVARGMPEGSELRFFGSDATARIMGPLRGIEMVENTRRQGISWTPVTEGETQTLELWIPPGSDPASVRIAPATVSHLDVRPSDRFKSTGIGAAQSCEVDVACRVASDSGLSRAARSVARIIYTDNGASYLCSGTLVSDGNRSSQVPYFYTAAHCIGSQATAATVNTFWFYEAPACGSRIVSEYRQLSRGATLLYANGDTDAALLRLEEPAPAGAWFSGWDSAPLGKGADLVALHHPKGDLKKISTGVFLEATPPSEGASYSTVAWKTGATEGGSSGSGIFTVAGGEYFLRGGLRGGRSSCENSGRIEDDSNRDIYSRLDLEAPNLQRWILAASAPLEDYEGLWWNPEEPGWGLTITQDAANHVFVAWYGYDSQGKPTWLVLPEGNWRSATTVEGMLYRASGTAIDRPYDPRRFSVSGVGSARIVFSDRDTAVLDLQFDGAAVTKTIHRQPI